MSPAPRASDHQSVPDRRRRVANAVTAWQRHLADVGGRNTLLWYADLPTGSLDLTTAHPSGVSMLLAGRPTRLSDLVREPTAFGEALRRVRAIRAKAVSLAEQRGLSTGFLAVGMATWEVPGIARSPHAPVLLRRCALRPTSPAATDFDVDLGDEVEFNPVLEHYLRSEEGIEVEGPALAGLAAVPSGFDPYPVYAALARLCAAVPGFTVTPRLVVSTFPHAKLEMVADLAAQQALLASHDVVAALAGSPAAPGAASPGPAPAPVVDPDPAAERLVLDADSGQGAVVEAVRRGESLVVHAAPGTGATQTVANLVAALASEGRSVLLVAQQRSALTDAVDRLARVGLDDLVFDAAEAAVERRAALERLVAGLDRVALADERPVAAGRRQERSDGRAAAGDRAAPDQPDLDRLRRQRDVLRDHVTALHAVREPWGVSAHQAQCAIAELASRSPAPASRVRLEAATLMQLSQARLAELARQLTDAAHLGAWSAQQGGDPWYGARITTPEDAERAQEIVGRLTSGTLDEAATTLDGILEESSLPPARTVSGWDHALTTMSGVRETLEVFRPEIFDVPLDEHLAATGSRAFRAAQEVQLSWWSRWRVRRQAVRMLRPGRPPSDLHAELLRAQRQRSAWQALVGAGGRPEISPRLDEAQAAYDAVHADLTWLGERLASTPAGGDLHGIPVEALKRRLLELAARPERLAVLPRVVPVIDELRAVGIGEVVDDFAMRAVPADQVTAELEQIWWVSLQRHIGDVDPRYGQHDGRRLRRTVADYVATDREHLDATARRVRAAVDRARQGAVSANRAHAAMLRAEVRRAGRPQPVPALFDSSRELLLSLAPCWAMSPLAVAETVPPGQWFDVVVIEGAGQLAPAEAVTAISRGRQVVAFGDHRQAPPTSFSTAVTERPASSRESDAEEPEPGPSVLEELARVLPSRSLDWHHGSADERLVAFANEAAYAGSLVTTPGTGLRSPVTFDLVDGTARVEPGPESAIESTDAEVDHVVELVLDHARSRPQESLGVITLNARHAERIREALDAALATPGRASGVALDTAAIVASDATADADEPVVAFFDPAEAPAFYVRTMAEAAGAPRDVVVLSVGFGKTPHGRVLHRFPSLSAPGAHRMLTTALTQGRRRLTVVSSITAEDLDPERMRGPAVLLLRQLLAHVAGASASSGPGRDSGPGSGTDSGPGSGTDSGAAADAAAEGTGTGAQEPSYRDPLMADLAGRLRREGLAVQENLGAGRRTVDLAVVDPDDPARFLVAVEGDGPGYAALRGTRERDRLWVEELERLGWCHVRIWSTDLYRDPAREVARVVAATREASAASSAGAVEPAPAHAEAPDHRPGEGNAPSSTDAVGASGQQQPGGEQPHGDQPGGDQPHGDQPHGDQPGGDQPGGDQPGGDQPGGKKKRRRAFRRATAGRSVEGRLDETDAGRGARDDGEGHDRWLREQRPPHWG